MDVTKPYKFIGFGAMDVTKPYKFRGPMDVTKKRLAGRGQKGWLAEVKPTSGWLAEVNKTIKIISSRSKY